MRDGTNMKSDEAAKIVEAFVALVSSRPKGHAVFRQSALPCSVEELKTAYFIFLDTEIMARRISDAEIEGYLKLASDIRYFVADEEADSLNQTYAAVLTKKPQVDSSESAACMQRLAQLRSPEFPSAAREFVRARLTARQN